MTEQTFDFERYLNIRSAYAPTWLADGRIAFLTDITGTPQVWAVDQSGGWPEQLSFFQDKVWAVKASPDGRQVICTRDVGGNERYQLFLISADGREVRRLTQNDEAIYAFGGWSHDGRRIAFASNGRNGIHFDIYVQDLADEAPKMVFQSDGMFMVQAWSPDDSHLVLSHEVGSAHQVLYLLDLESGEVRPLTPTDEDVVNQQVKWPAGDSIQLLTNRGRDRLGLAQLDTVSGQASFLFEPAWELEGLAFSADGKMMATVTNEDGYSRLHLHEPAADRISLVEELPDGVIGTPAFSPDGRQLAVSVQSPQHNLDIWCVDTATRACRRVTRSSLAGIPQGTLAKPELIRYPTFDGREIPAFFYRPAGFEPPHPVILYVHGGPASQTRPDFDPRFQFFLNRGYAILAPNVRGSTGYGKEYAALDDVELRMDSVTDLKYAADWLSTQPEADGKRIAIYGRSYGGFMVLAAVTSYPDLWAAAIDVVGIGNWVTFLEKTGGWRRAHREHEYGSLTHDRAFLESISPIHKVDMIQAPMLVVHGANDPRVPVAEADQIVESLRRRDHPVEYLCYPDEGHKISKLKNRIDSFTKMAEFLAQYL